MPSGCGHCRKFDSPSHRAAAFRSESADRMADTIALRHAADVLAPVSVVTLPGKGRSMRADAAIAAGTPIVRERAAIWCTHAARKALKSLDGKSARTFLAAVAGSDSTDVLQLAPVNLAPSADTPAAAALPYPPCVTSVVDRWLAISGAGPRPRVPAADVAAMERAVALKLIMDANSFVANVRTAGCGEPPAGTSAGAAVAAAATAAGGVDAKRACAHPPPKQQCAAVALLTSMLNHSCLPNVAHVWSWDCRFGAPVVTVVAVRDIAAGEELCTRYIDVETRPRHSRKQTLRERYGFTCTCARCAGKHDDAMTFRCPRTNGRCTLDEDATSDAVPGHGGTAGAGCLGRVPGWSTVCSACGARYDDDADVIVDDRSALLAELLDDGRSAASAGGDGSTAAAASVAGAAAPRGSVGALTTAPLLTALSEIAAVDGDDAAAGDASGVATAAGAVAASSAADGRFYAGPKQPVWAKLLQLLHPSDAALLPLLRSQAVVALVRHNDAATALELATAAHDALPHVPFLEPLSRLGLLVLYADVCCCTGKPAAASAAYTEAAAIENGLCKPLHVAQENACGAASASAGGDAAAAGTQYGAELLRLAAAPPATTAELAEAQARRAGLKRTGGR